VETGSFFQMQKKDRQDRMAPARPMHDPFSRATPEKSATPQLSITVMALAVAELPPPKGKRVSFYPQRALP
jgi:hypothetical protein